MASSVALSASPVSASAATSPSSETRTGAARHAAHDDFARPLHEARQQHATATRNGASSQASSKSKAAVSHDAADDRDKDSDKDKPAKAGAADATTAMLALLGQSVPAMGAATPAAAIPAGDGSDGEAKPTTGAVATTAGLAGMQALTLAAGAAPQSAADDAGDDAGAVDGLKDNALSSLTGDADDTATAALATVSTTDAKTDASGRASPAIATQGDRSDPLDALRAMTASPLMQQAVAVQPSAPAHALSMSSAVGSSSFGQELGQQVAWLGGQDIKQARIRLHPEDLGQLDVKVSVQHDHVDVSFIAQHPQAVHAVQQTLAQLDAMLAHHGLALGHAEVGQGGRGDANSQGASSGAAAGGEGSSGDEGLVASVVAPVVKAVGLLDMFA